MAQKLEILATVENYEMTFQNMKDKDFKKVITREDITKMLNVITSGLKNGTSVNK